MKHFVELFLFVFSVLAIHSLCVSRIVISFLICWFLFIYLLIHIDKSPLLSVPLNLQTPQLPLREAAQPEPTQLQVQCSEQQIKVSTYWTMMLPKGRRWWGHNKQHLLLPAHPGNYETVLMAASQLPNEFTYWSYGRCLLTVTLPSPSAHSAAAQWSPAVQSATADQQNMPVMDLDSPYDPNV